MQKIIVSHKYDLSKRELRNGTTDNYKLLAAEILLSWAKGLYYFRRHERPEYRSVCIPYEYREDKQSELESFPGTPVCQLCEGLTDIKCWDVYNEVFEYLEDHKRVQKRDKSLALATGRGGNSKK